mmetsp:Transcript_16819/g.40707  ORF Transcript_16819/g.40707 Transcript_16819/m.40707 type:complete len:90 (+) Transcript_16819:1158-1427(+)
MNTIKQKNTKANIGNRTNAREAKWLSSKVMSSHWRKHPTKYRRLGLSEFNGALPLRTTTNFFDDDIQYCNEMARMSMFVRKVKEADDES